MSTSASLPIRDAASFLKPRIAVALACLCAAAGLCTVYPSVRMLLSIWSTDALKSMGLVVPFVSAALILRVWRQLGWETEGSWWGFAMLAVASALVFIREQTLLIVVVHRDWSLQLPPLPLVAVVYAASIVLLFGGWRLLRAAWFPVLLMWAVIPVPETFANRIDLPLQHASATVARAFAHTLGQHLTEDKLRLMFTPEYGMFIAPGCNGIRGAITLGLAALIVSYLYRFRPIVFAPVVAGAVMLGYVFNFLRLCLLVIYYKLTLPYPWFQHRAKTADYLIGGTLFVCALSLFFAVANALRRDPADTYPAPPTERVSRPLHASAYLARVAAVLVLSLIFGLDASRQIRAEHLNEMQIAPPPLPAAVGTWQRVRTWNDTELNGWIIYTWAEYASPDPAQPHVSFGVSPRLDRHDAELCHVARGDDPIWHGQISDASPSGPVVLAAALYNNGVTQKLEAASTCKSGLCQQYSESGKHITLVTARPEGRLPLAESLRPVPVLLQVQSTDTVSPREVVQPQLEAALASFLHEANLPAITDPYARLRH